MKSRLVRICIVFQILRWPSNHKYSTAKLTGAQITKLQLQVYHLGETQCTTPGQNWGQFLPLLFWLFCEIFRYFFTYGPPYISFYLSAPSKEIFLPSPLTPTMYTRSTSQGNHISKQQAVYSASHIYRLFSLKYILQVFRGSKIFIKICYLTNGLADQNII